MKISLRWLTDYLDWSGTVDELSAVLTRTGLSVEGVAQRGADFPQVVVAQILESVQHPNADRLSVCKVDDGSGSPRQIVCGAKNYRIGDKVPLALPGAVLPGDFRIKVGKLRGVESEGMMCSGKELGLGEDHAGLMILPSEARIGSPISDVFPSDSVFDLEITPNRPDWLSHIGVAREVAAFTGSQFKILEVAVDALDENSPLIGAIDRGACPFYSLRRIEKVRIGPSPAWLRERLESVGLRSINNVVDVTNFVMLEMGQPLHAFDGARVIGSLRVRQAEQGEILEALNGAHLELQQGDLVIADDARSLALAGVIGGERSGVTEATTDVLLESAFFQPPGIRRTARRLEVHTDSSYRFERGVDPRGVLTASQRAAALIVELCGGQVQGEVAIRGELPVETRELRLRRTHCERLLGKRLNWDWVDEGLERLGLARLLVDGDATTWKIPSFRAGDLRREIDLFEEVARLYGIERITGRLHSSPAPVSQADRAYDSAANLRDRLCGSGFFEIRTGTLAPPSDAPLSISVRNPLGEEQSTLRSNLLDGLLNALGRNARNGCRTMRAFEIGRVFQKGEPEERYMLALGGYALPDKENWRSQARETFDLFDLKGVVQMLFLERIDFRPITDARFLLAMEVLREGKRVGMLGQLRPAKARELDVRAALVVGEIELSSFDTSASLEFHYRPIHRTPSVTRDLAPLVSLQCAYEQIAESLRAAGEDLLENIELIDVFQDPSGAKLPADRKSVAISLTLRSSERTLTAEEANAVTERLKERLKVEMGAEFRSGVLDL